MSCESRVLFVLKKRNQYGYPGYFTATGLYQAALFCVNTLQRAGVEADVAVVVDNNDIDREVARFRPTTVIIEALWVVPEKFDVLQRLHPGVQWIVRVHSNLPFLALEGIAVEWIKGYLSRGVYVSGNNHRIDSDLLSIARCAVPNSEDFVVFLPNCYDVDPCAPPLEDRGEDGVVRVACLGSMRPLKNHLTQAVAAVKFSQSQELSLEFHVNSGRIEGGAQVLKNLRSLFTPGSACGDLVEHPWMPRDEYLALLSTMDVGMQVSLSETFNVISADMVTRRLPIVVSHEIEWAPRQFKADATDTDSIAEVMCRAWEQGWWGTWRNLRHLERYSESAAKVWVEYFADEDDDRDWDDEEFQAP